ncbi:MAG: 1-pyrroline-5-carboxylate dehydrogenase, partial [Bacteroidales bacterium]|nr:1-pyrroline-5-carboxylate dehydrogenase [Bacteroidales bacterium]
MAVGFFHVANPKNEPTLSYAPGTKEREELQEALKKAKSEEIEIPMYIGGKEVFTGKTKDIRPPHEHAHKLGCYHEGDTKEIQDAIKSALAVKEEWAQ